MASLYLPAPTKTTLPSPATTTKHNTTPTTTKVTKKKVPSYEERCQSAAELVRARKKNQSIKKSLFVPRSIHDFGDGGSFPEIHVAQYPRHMGNPHSSKKGTAAKSGNSGGGSSRALVVSGGIRQSNEVLNVEVDATGKVSYDAIVKSGTNADKLVYTKHSDLKGSNPTKDDIALPTPEEEQSTTERTKNALHSLIAAQTALAKPTGSAMINAATSHNQEEKTQFVKYTPSPNAPGYNPAASAQRVIQMVPAQIDPMMPPKHQHRKAPRGPAEDPVPILHAPPEKLSKEEREAWNIPACISNWKNTRGYTIPLDKRLAADGRGLRDDTTINSNFATLSESLYVAERQAREEVRARAKLQKKVLLEQKEKREEELRELARQARNQRSGTEAPPPSSSEHEAAPPMPPAQDSEEEVAAKQRELLRLERKRERDRELRQENAGKIEKEEEVKKARLEDDRDVSEKIALGTFTGSGGGGGGVDGRLYNQEGGMDSGFGAEDEYNTYTKPMFDRESVTSSSIYRPTRGEAALDADEQYDKLKSGATSKFVPDQGFAGAEGGGSSGGGGRRSAPVQFERSS
uniref:SKI-interacting protein SKIP SNW domain-containing protein n=1 Tax=Ditylum brightwellii TaxID=49249 RepID=A0A7S1YTR3_9STRA|mmetsp:Transcript_17251/g.25705  ORF Transcript_17251/g.25705 Transcript_17251/m.25705 type:complete len:575 (+) Transcript_17251:133-1857(+)